MSFQCFIVFIGYSRGLGHVAEPGIIMYNTSQNIRVGEFAFDVQVELL